MSLNTSESKASELLPQPHTVENGWVRTELGDVEIFDGRVLPAYRLSDPNSDGSMDMNFVDLPEGGRVNLSVIIKESKASEFEFGGYSIKCDRCDGTGWTIEDVERGEFGGARECPDCNATGKIEMTSSIPDNLSESKASEYQLGQDMGEYELAKRYWNGEWEGFGDSGDEIGSMATRGAKIISDSEKEQILRNSKDVQEYGIQYATSTSWDDLSEEDMITIIQSRPSLGESKANEDYDDDLFTSGDYIGMVSSGDEEEGFKFLDDYFGIGSEITNRPRKDVDFDKLVRTIEKKIDLGSSDDRDTITFAKKWLGESKANEEHMSIKDAVASLDNHIDQFVENSVFDEDSYNKEIARLTGWDETTVMMAIHNISEDPDDPYNEKIGTSGFYEAKANEYDDDDEDDEDDDEDYTPEVSVEEAISILKEYPDGLTGPEWSKKVAERHEGGSASFRQAELQGLAHTIDSKTGERSIAGDKWVASESKAKGKGEWSSIDKSQDQLDKEMDERLERRGFKESRANETSSYTTDYFHIAHHEAGDPCPNCGSTDTGKGREVYEAGTQGWCRTCKYWWQMTGEESKANENSNWKAFTNAQRQEIIDLADVSISADTEWEDISVPDQEDLSIHLVSQGALANADFTGFADEYVNKIKLDGLNVKNHVRETLRDKINNWKVMDKDVRREESEIAGIDQDVIDTIVDMSLDKIRKKFPEEHKKLDQVGVWGFGESKASPEYLHQQRRRLLAKAEEDRVCPVCGEKSPYVRMGDFWETHFADKHRLNESRANEGKYHVIIKNRKTGEIAEDMIVDNFREAMDVEAGASINMNRADWKIVIESETESRANEDYGKEKVKQWWDSISQDERAQAMDEAFRNDSSLRGFFDVSSSMYIDSYDELSESQKSVAYTMWNNHHLSLQSESRANEVSAEEEEVANDLWQALGEGGLLGDYIGGGIFKFDITYPSWVEDPEMDMSSIGWDELTATDKQNVVNHFGGVEGMKEKLCDEGWDNYCYADESKANEDFIPEPYDKHFKWVASMDQDDYHCNHCGEMMGWDHPKFGRMPLHTAPVDEVVKVVKAHLSGHGITESKANELDNDGNFSVFGLIANRGEIECIAEAENFGYSCASEIFMHVYGTTKVTPEQVKQAKFILENWDLHNLHPYKTKAMYFGNESKANEERIYYVTKGDYSEDIDANEWWGQLMIIDQNELREKYKGEWWLKSGKDPIKSMYELEFKGFTANENVASKMAYYYQKDAPKDWNDNQVSNEAEKILEETYGIKPKKEVVKVEAKESLSTIQQKIVDRKLDGVRNESIIHELKIWDNMSEEQAKKAVETTEIPLQDSIAYTLFNKKYTECNENEIQELKIYAGESKAKEVDDGLVQGIMRAESGEMDDEELREFVLKYKDTLMQLQGSWQRTVQSVLSEESRVNEGTLGNKTPYPDPECKICGRVMINVWGDTRDEGDWSRIENAIKSHYQEAHYDDETVRELINNDIQSQHEIFWGESKAKEYERQDYGIGTPAGDIIWKHFNEVHSMDQDDVFCNHCGEQMTEPVRKALISGQDETQVYFDHLANNHNISYESKKVNKRRGGVY